MLTNRLNVVLSLIKGVETLAQKKVLGSAVSKKKGHVDSFLRQKKINDDFLEKGSTNKQYFLLSNLYAKFSLFIERRSYLWPTHKWFDFESFKCVQYVLQYLHMSMT